MRKLYFPLFLGAASIAGAAATFHYNVAGYDSNLPKALVVESSEMLTGVEYTVKKGGTSVASGTFGYGSIPTEWTNGFTVYYNLDFSQVKTPGNYTIEFVYNGSTVTSKTIVVADKNIADSTLGLVLNYFRLDRNTLTGHKTAWIKGSNNQHVNVYGGWSDASGDYGTYLSHLSYANYMNPQQIPLTVWALAFANERIPNMVASATSSGFALDESLWGADYLVRMQSEDGFFYMTVFNGWSASDDGWTLCAFSGSSGTMSSDYQAAYREGGGMAIAALARASTLGKNGEKTSQQYLAAAKKGFDHLENKQTLGGACEYCDNKVENIIDDYTALFAAMELYNATKESSYWTVAQNRAAHLIGRLSDEGYFWSDNNKTRPFYHASDAGLPLVALIRYLELEKDLAKATAVRTAAKKHLDWMIKVTDRSNNHFGYAKQVVKTGGSIKTSFFIPHDNETGYWFQGESARLGSLASAAVYASRMLGYADSVKAFGYAVDQLDWLLGKNPYDLSVMKGVGSKNPPAYQGYSNTTFKGGIANGITGKNMDGSGITWDNVSDIASQLSSLGETAADWQTWRWEEQWLPHATWYLMALATRYDEKPVKGAVVIPSSSSSGQGGPSSSAGGNGDIASSNSNGGNSNPTNSSGSKDNGGKNTDGLFQVTTAAGFSVLQSGNALQVSFASPAQRKFRLMDVHGHVVMSSDLLGSVNTVQTSSVPKGIYLVHVQGFAPKKIVVK